MVGVDWRVPLDVARARIHAAKPGVRVLSSDFWFREGKWDVNCELPDDVSAYIASHEAWKDFQSGLVFSMVDIVCNSVPLDRSRWGAASCTRRSGATTLSSKRSRIFATSILSAGE